MVVQRVTEKLEVRNPATNAVVGSVALTRIGDVAEAVARARASQPAWQSRTFNERAAVIRRFHDLILDRSSHIFDVIQSETGKARRDALGELVTVAGTARYYLATADASGRQAKERRCSVCHASGSCLPRSWRCRFNQSLELPVPASHRRCYSGVTCGNAVVLKPSELTPLSAELGRQLLVESGLDGNLFSVLHGRGDVGAELIGHVDYVGFTGGTETGRSVATAAAKRLLPYSLELGGKNPMIVLKGAPIESAATGLVVGAFSNSGQTCIAIERVYVEEPIFEEFAHEVAERASRLKLGWSTSWDIDVGSLIHSAHASKVMRHVLDATSKGATLITGGRVREDLVPRSSNPRSFRMSGRTCWSPIRKRSARSYRYTKSVAWKKPCPVRTIPTSV